MLELTPTTTGPLRTLRASGRLSLAAVTLALLLASAVSWRSLHHSISKQGCEGFTAFSMRIVPYLCLFPLLMKGLLARQNCSARCGAACCCFGGGRFVSTALPDILEKSIDPDSSLSISSIRIALCSLILQGRLRASDYLPIIPSEQPTANGAYISGTALVGEVSSPVCGSASSDIFKGVYEGSEVAIKRLRVFDETLRRELHPVRPFTVVRLSQLTAFLRIMSRRWQSWLRNPPRSRTKMSCVTLASMRCFLRRSYALLPLGCRIVMYFAF
jgi:hypothetical protein